MRRSRCGGSCWPVLMFPMVIGKGFRSPETLRCRSCWRRHRNIRMCWRAIAGPRDAEVAVSLVAGPDLSVTEQTLNSFLHCCTDVSRVGRFLIIDEGLSAQARVILHERYTFLELADCAPGTGLRDYIHGRYWLHLGQGWRFFAPEKLITRLVAVLEAETQVFQVGINLADAAGLTEMSALEMTVRRAPDAGRYVVADVVA